MKILTLLVFLLAGCGEMENLPGITFSESSGAPGYVQLNISNAKGAIADYRLWVSGDGMEAVKQTISAQAAGVEIQGIPAGLNRTLRIEALNAKGQTVREGLLEGITIEPGKTAILDMVLQAVPVVLNLEEGNYQSNRRLSFQILSDAGHRVGVTGLRDVVIGESERTVSSDGTARFYPGILSAGTHTFEIVDYDTGKSVQLNLHLWEGQGVEAAPFVSASLNDASRLGQAVVGEETFSDIAEGLWNVN